MTDPISLGGILVVDKPTGPTSHDIVACVRRALQIQKVGHLGTLDPLATGVLPLVVGQATRLASLFATATKQYDAVIRLGLATDTCDITGTVLAGSKADTGVTGVDSRTPPASRETIIMAVSSFTGAYQQLPPTVSAKRVGGVRAYELARQRRPVKVQPVPVVVEALTLLSIDGPRVRCRIACSSGFYVRALARDLGHKLGCGGCLETLRRERHGPFGLADAVPLARIVDHGVTASAFVVPMDGLLPEVPGVVVTPDGARRAAHGNPLRLSDIVPTPGVASAVDTALVRILDDGGRLLAIAERRPDGALHPKIVLV